MTMKSADMDVLNEKLGGEIEYGIVQGHTFSGHTALCNQLSETYGIHVISIENIK